MSSSTHTNSSSTLRSVSSTASSNASSTGSFVEVGENINLDTIPDKVVVLRIYANKVTIPVICESIATIREILVKCCDTLHITDNSLFGLAIKSSDIKVHRYETTKNEYYFVENEIVLTKSFNLFAKYNKDLYDCKDKPCYQFYLKMKHFPTHVSNVQCRNTIKQMFYNLRDNFLNNQTLFSMYNEDFYMYYSYLMIIAEGIKDIANEVPFMEYYPQWIRKTRGIQNIQQVLMSLQNNKPLTCEDSMLEFCNEAIDGFFKLNRHFYYLETSKTIQSDIHALLGVSKEGIESWEINYRQLTVKMSCNVWKQIDSISHSRKKVCIANLNNVKQKFYIERIHVASYINTFCKFFHLQQLKNHINNL
uniref:FERM domain-containing protein n=1 Tax=Rhabditophanes sp. KR3021 TaxID=114890 RepID=A0AC35UEA1_9BILA